MGFTYSQPFVIKQAIILGQLPKTEFFDNYGYGLIGAFALVYTGLSVRFTALHPSQVLILIISNRLLQGSTCGESDEPV